MSLQIWLPLISDIHNQGLVDSKFSLASGGTLSFGEGKFGTCLTNGQITATNQNLVTSLTTTNKFSYTFWVKPYATINTWLMIIGGGSGNIRGIYWNASTYRLQWAYSGSGVNFSTASVVPTDEWTHVGITVDGASVKCYINGDFISTITSTKTDAITTNGTIKVFGNNGYFNDVRIYDETLSPLQIKQISQGLVAHYLLNNNGSGNNNLGLNSYNLDISEAVNNKYFSKRRSADIIQLREDGFTEVKSYGSSYGGIGIYANLLNLQIDTKITFSFYAYTNGSLKNISFFPMIYNSSGTRDTSSKLLISVDGGSYTETNNKIIDEINNIIPKRHFVTFEWNNTMKNILDNGGKIELTIQFSGTWQNGDYGCIFAPKLEYGDKPTPWCPNLEDSLTTQLGYDNNIEYDVSGYCYNGIKYNITDYSTDTPKYSLSTVFNGTNSYINIGKGGKVKDAITVSSWVYMNDWSTYSNPFISCTQTGGWNFSKNGSNLRFLLGTGTTSNTNKNAQVLLSSLTSGWHMITATYDGLVVSLYIDGILTHDNTIYSTKTPIYYNATNDIIIGAEAGSGATPTGEYFNGRISDVRIYATALSDTDVLALFKNSAYIDSFGNVFASEYNEE